MSDNFVINTKVIVSVSATFILLVLTIIMNNFVTDSREFKKDMKRDVQQINEKLNILLGDYKVQEEKVKGLEKINDFQDVRLNHHQTRLEQMLGDYHPVPSRLQIKPANVN